MTQHLCTEFDPTCFRCDLSRDEICGATHPHLPADRGCEEPTGHAGYHVVNDGCGRAEYFWPNA